MTSKKKLRKKIRMLQSNIDARAVDGLRAQREANRLRDFIEALAHDHYVVNCLIFNREGENVSDMRQIDGIRVPIVRMDGYVIRPKEKADHDYVADWESMKDWTPVGEPVDGMQEYVARTFRWTNPETVTTSTHKPDDPWQAVNVPPTPGPVVIHSPRFGAAHYAQEDDGA